MASIYAKRGWLYVAKRDAVGRRRAVALRIRDTPSGRVEALQAADSCEPVERPGQKPGPSLVYFLQESGRGFIKIGCTTALPGRLSDLGWATPHELVLLATKRGDKNLERQFHRQFESARVSGEWFRPVPELLALIETL
jgi:hypothetical protein